MSKELKLPDYPALATALLVESRFGVKMELEKDIKGTGLFLEVRLAASLASAKLSLELEQIDCCILGPGLSREVVMELLSWAPSHTKSKDVAYTAVSDSKKEGDELLTSKGAHSQVWRPLSKAKLFDAIVRAVVAANKNSSWAAIFKNSDFHKNFENEVVCPLLADAAKRTTSESVLSAPEKVLGLSHLSKAEVEEVVKVFTERNLLFDKKGEPTNDLRIAALRLLDYLFPFGPPENERFISHCTKAVYAWFENAPLGGIKEANEQLRMSVLQFRG